MTEYEDIIDECKEHSFKLKELIPKLYEALTKVGREPKDAGDKVKRDLTALGWSKDYINTLLPDEAKDARVKEARNLVRQSNTEIPNADGTVSLNKEGGVTNQSQDDQPPTATAPTADPDIHFKISQAIQLLRSASKSISEPIQVQRIYDPQGRACYELVIVQGRFKLL